MSWNTGWSVDVRERILFRTHGLRLLYDYNGMMVEIHSVCSEVWPTARKIRGLLRVSISSKVVWYKYIDTISCEFRINFNSYLPMPCARGKKEAQSFEALYTSSQGPPQDTLSAANSATKGSHLQEFVDHLTITLAVNTDLHLSSPSSETFGAICSRCCLDRLTD